MYNPIRSRYTYLIAVWTCLLVSLLNAQTIMTIKDSSRSLVNSIITDKSVTGFTRALYAGRFTYRGSVNYKSPFRIERGSMWLQLTPIAKANNPNAYKDGDDVVYADAWVNTDVRLGFASGFIKETLILKGSSAPDTFSWKIETNLTRNKIGKLVRLNGLADIKEPYAYDALGDTVAVDVKLTKVAGSWYYSYIVNKSGVTYPLTIDPTITIAPGTTSASSVWIQAPDLGYTSTNLIVRYDTVGKDTISALLYFPITGIPEGSVITSATCSLYAHTVNSTIPVFSAGLLRQFTGSATWATYNGSNAWTAPGAYGAGTDYYSPPTDTVSVSDVGWYVWDVTSYIQSVVGTDSIQTNYGLLFASKRDANYGNGAMFGSSAYANTTRRPILTIEYSAAPTPAPSAPVLTRPTSLLATDSLLLTYTDAVNDTTSHLYAIKMTSPYVYWVDTIGGNRLSADSVWAKWSKFNQGINVNAPNKLISLMAFAKDTSNGLVSPSSNLTSGYTRAVPPDSVDYVKYAEIAVKINSLIFDDDSASSSNMRVAFKDLVRYPRRWLDTATTVGDEDTAGCDTSWTLATSVKAFKQLIPNTNNVFEVFAQNGDTIRSYPDTFIITFVDYQTGGGGGGGVTIGQVRNAISDSMDLARAAISDSIQTLASAWQADINDSLKAFNNATYPDSAEAFVMVQDTTWGGTVLRKLKTLLGRVLY